MRVADRTNGQLQRLHAILAELKIDKEAKAEIIYAITEGETSSAGDLNFYEAKELIEKLERELQSVGNIPNPYLNQSVKPETKEAESKQKMRRTILSRCYTLHWTDNDGVDYARLDAFLLKHGAVKKKLNDLEHDELVKVVTQFNQMDINQYR